MLRGSQLVYSSLRTRRYTTHIIRKYPHARDLHPAFRQRSSSVSHTRDLHPALRHRPSLPRHTQAFTQPVALDVEGPRVDSDGKIAWSSLLGWGRIEGDCAGFKDAERGDEADDVVALAARIVVGALRAHDVHAGGFLSSVSLRLASADG